MNAEGCWPDYWVVLGSIYPGVFDVVEAAFGLR